MDSPAHVAVDDADAAEIFLHYPHYFHQYEIQIENQNVTSSLARECCAHDGCVAFSAADAPVSRLMVCDPCVVGHEYDCLDFENQMIVAMPLGHPRWNRIHRVLCHQIQSHVENDVDYDMTLEDEMKDGHHGDGSLRMTCLA